MGFKCPTRGPISLLGEAVEASPSVPANAFSVATRLRTKAAMTTRVAATERIAIIALWLALNLLSVAPLISLVSACCSLNETPVELGTIVAFRMIVVSLAASVAFGAIVALGANVAFGAIVALGDNVAFRATVELDVSETFPKMGEGATVGAITGGAVSGKPTGASMGLPTETGGGATGSTLNEKLSDRLLVVLSNRPR